MSRVYAKCMFPGSHKFANTSLLSPASTRNLGRDPSEIFAIPIFLPKAKLLLIWLLPTLSLFLLSPKVISTYHYILWWLKEENDLIAHNQLIMIEKASLVEWLRYQDWNQESLSFSSTLHTKPLGDFEPVTLIQHKEEGNLTPLSNLHGRHPF